MESHSACLSELVCFKGKVQRAIRLPPPSFLFQVDDGKTNVVFESLDPERTNTRHDQISIMFSTV